MSGTLVMDLDKSDRSRELLFAPSCSLKPMRPRLMHRRTEYTSLRRGSSTGPICERTVPK